MAVLTMTAIARAALATLYENSVMLPLVSRDWDNEFVPGRGATVRVRKPGTFTAPEYNGTTVSRQRIAESYADVTLNHHRDVTVQVTSREMAFEIVDFREQVIDPALKAIAKAVDTDILSLRDDITQVVGDGVYVPYVGATATSWVEPESLIDAGIVLGQALVPEDSYRYAVVDSVMAGVWQKDELFKSNAMAAGTDLATQSLLNASLGQRRFGFAPYRSDNITDRLGVAFHKTAFTLATRPLALPLGVPAEAKAIENYNGIGIRCLYGYNFDTKSDEISFDIVYGVKTMDATRAVLIGVSTESSGS